MRARLLPVLALMLASSLACAEFQKGFDQGASEGMVENFQKAEGKLQALPPSPARKRLLALCGRGKTDAAAGKFDLVEGSVFLGELDAAISDGSVTDEEAASFEQKYQQMLAS